MINVKHFIVAAALLCAAGSASAQKNPSLSPTPPMGWNSWNWFGKKDITEEAVREVIDAIVENGYKEAGYDYIIIDGGWRDAVLGPDGLLAAHPERFPNGIAPLAAYAHSKGLKLGLHIVPGTADCGGDPVGSWGREELHLAQFKEWGVDFLKIDLCRFTADDLTKPAMETGWTETKVEGVYRKWSELLYPSGILFSISAYKSRDWYPGVCNMARTTADIKCRSNGGAVFDRPKAKGAVMSIAEVNDRCAAAAGDGYWNDPDMLAIGGQGLAPGEEKAHFALWCIMSAPLMLGNDPRNTTDGDRYVLLNAECIAVDQDASGQGGRVWRQDGLEVWVKKLSGGRRAVLMLNRNASPAEFRLDFAAAGLEDKLKLRDLYEKKDLGRFAGSYTRTVAGHDCLFLLAVPR